MKRQLLIVLLVFGLFASAPAVGTADDGRRGNIVVLLEGPGEFLEEPLVEGALCYETDLMEATSGRVIGTGVDCLADITAVGDGFLIDRTTIFRMPGGEIWANGPTSVVPTTGGSPDFTHIVGDIPAPGTNSIVDVTGRFAGASGSVRLSGAVNMAAFPDTIGFNCLFVIDLD